MTQEAHTQEPWEIRTSAHYKFEDCSHREIIIDPDGDEGGIVIGEIFYSDTGDGEAEANARRIVACVNALAGIPIEAIESGVVAELVDAAQRIIDGGYVSQHIEEERADYDALTSALAKLEVSK